VELSLIEWQLLKFFIENAQEDGRCCRICNDQTFDPFGKRGRSYFTKHFHVAAISLLQKDLIVIHSVTEWGSDYKVADGVILPEKPIWKPRSLPKLQPRDLEVLKSLEDNRWYALMDVGGQNGTHHSRSLQKLVAHGFAVERNGRIFPHPPSIYKRSKGSCYFKITKAGKQFRERK